VTALTPHVITVALALLSAALFATGTLLVKRGLKDSDSITGALIQIVVSFVAFACLAPWTIQAADWRSSAVWIFAIVGLLRPAFSTILANEGNHRLGPTISTTMESVSPIFAVLGGMVFLAERMTLGLALGTLGVVLGVAVLSWRGRVPRSWPAWALAFPVGAALIRSGAHVAVKEGLLLLPNVVMSGLVAYGVSTVVACGVRATQPLARRPRLLQRRMGWFALSGISNAGAIFALNSALMRGQVVLVSPLVAVYPLFTMLGAWLFLRNETVTLRTVLAVLIIVPAVILISLGH
jgi:drug/metabolite transporter (DMT)-like permease